MARTQLIDVLKSNVIVMYGEVLNVSITFDHTKSNYKEEGGMRIFTFQNHCKKLSGVNFVSDTQFSYQRSLKLSFEEGSLGYQDHVNTGL